MASYTVSTCPFPANHEETHTGFIPDEGANLKQMVEGYGQEILIDALKSIGNAAAVARYLQTTQRIINYRIKNLGIEPKSYK